jgi:hypothetical protein
MMKSPCLLEPISRCLTRAQPQAHSQPSPPLQAHVAASPMLTNHPPWVERHSNSTRAIHPPHPKCFLSIKLPRQDHGVHMHCIGHSVCWHFAVDADGRRKRWTRALLAQSITSCRCATSRGHASLPLMQASTAPSRYWTTLPSGVLCWNACD